MRTPSLLSALVSRFNSRARLQLPRAVSPAKRPRVLDRVHTRPYLVGPGLREAPANIITALREVDPTAELHYLGFGVWIFGFVRWNRHVVREAEDRLLNYRSLPEGTVSFGLYWANRLYAQGLRPFGGDSENPEHIGMHDDSAIESGRLVRDVRYADWCYRTDREAAFRRNLEGSDTITDLKRRINLMLDFHQSEGRSVWRHSFAHRHSVLIP